ncbi:tripartite motif-containing protein 3-like [Saccostrea cucullata]|uniref:tripartite motif-containing protein 3-like n=1 Tax=Saccostrea cuccullata TaxID=36930 RepID=UPI002ED29DD2
MAQRVVDNLQNDYLICSICLGRYNDPRLLPCGHTFCRQCLSDHIDQSVRSANADHFKCPNDRGDVRRPGPNVPLRQWADKFPVDTFISSLLQAVQHHEQGPTPSEPEVNARPRRGPVNPRPRPQQTQRPGRGPQQNPAPPPPQHESNGLTCLEHPARQLEFFCLGCSILICSHCAVQNHRRHRCECLSTEEALRKLSPKLEQLKTKFQNQLSYIQDLNRNGMPFDTELENSKAEAFNYLSSVENRVSEFTQQCLREIENLKSTVRETGQNIPREDGNMASLLSRLQETRQGYESIFNAPPGENFLRNLNKYEVQADTYESEIERAISNNPVPQIDLVTNAAFQNFLRNPPPVARMEIKELTTARQPRQQVRREATFTMSNGRRNRSSR